MTSIKARAAPRLKITHFELQVVHWRWCYNTVEWSKSVLISNLLTIQFKLRFSYFAIHVKGNHCLKEKDKQSEQHQLYVTFCFKEDQKYDLAITGRIEKLQRNLPQKMINLNLISSATTKKEGMQCMQNPYYKKTETNRTQISYLVHPSTHILVCLTHGDLSAERANCKFYIKIHFFHSM